MRTLRRILAQYGMIAVVVHLVLHTAVLFGFYLAIKMGWTPTGIAGEAGVWTVAYILTKLTQPPRLALTVLITPFIARLLSARTRNAKASKA